MEYLNQLRDEVRTSLIGIPLLTDFFKGQGDPKYYARYLENVWHYAQHSSVVIGMAGARAVPTHPALADYLLRHAQEELGHEEWALQDLAALGVPADKVKRSRPVPKCAAMIGLEYYIAGHANPVGLFGWLFVLEAMGDDLGHLASEAVAKGLQLPDGIRFLAGHGEADAEHTKEIVEQIEAHAGPEDMEEINHVAEVMGDLYVGMFREIAEGR